MTERSRQQGSCFTLLGYIVLAVGGWLGGTIVFVHGTRVLAQPDMRTADAVSVEPVGEQRL